MPQVANMNVLMQTIKLLTLDEQRKLNSLLVANIRAGQKAKAAEVSMNIEVGQVIKFDGKTRGLIYLEVTGFSRDLTKLKGRQINKGWKTSAGTPWTVGASIVKLVPPTEAELARASTKA